MSTVPVVPVPVKRQREDDGNEGPPRNIPRMELEAGSATVAASAPAIASVPPQ